MTDDIMAQVPASADDNEVKNIYLAFNVGNDIYSTGSQYVLHIVGMQEITGIPEILSIMKGFTNLHGNTILVVSMRLRFCKEEGGYTKQICIIVVRVGERKIDSAADPIIDMTSTAPEPTFQQLTVAGSRGYPSKYRRVT